MVSWRQALHGLELVGQGSQPLLALPMTAFFASRQCPGVAIRQAMDWALEQARVKTVVVSGFHSPLEQSVLKVLLTARSPVVAVLARPVQQAKLPLEWSESLAQGRMAVVGTATEQARLTQGAAGHRNAQAAQMAVQIVVAYASPAGSLAGLVAQWQLAGRPVVTLWNHGTNAPH